MRRARVVCTLCRISHTSPGLGCAVLKGYSSSGVRDESQRRAPNDVGSVFGYRIRYTGFWVARKSHCILALVSEILRTMTPTRREVAELLNKLMWSDPAFFNVLLYTQALQGLIHEIEHHWQWDKRLTINSMAARK